MATSRISTSSVLQGFPKSRSLLAGNAGFDPAATFLIQRVTSTGSSGTIEFTSIPQTYKHLQVRFMGRASGGTTASSPVGLRVNQTGTYARHRLYGNGSSATATGSTGNGNAYVAYQPLNGALANAFGVAIIDILDYTDSTKLKTIRSFSGVDTNTSSTNWTVDLSSALNASTAAVTSLDIFDDNGYNFASGTTIALYGMVG